MMKEKSFISVVFYMRNYQDYIKKFIETIVPLFEERFEYFEMICVNNNATDNSLSILKDTYTKNNYTMPLNIVTLSQCKSIDDALSAGIELAIGDFIYSFNSVLIDYDLNMIFESYKQTLDGNDAVIVSPNKKTTYKQKLYYTLYNLGVNKRSKIYPERFKVLSRRVVNRIGNMSNYIYPNMSGLKTCGLEIKTIFYCPSKSMIKYDKEELSERMHKSLESLFLYTNTFQYIMLIMSILLIIISAILFMVNFVNIAVMSFTSGILILSIAVIIIFMHIQTKLILTNNIYLIKNVDKVVK